MLRRLHKSGVKAEHMYLAGMASVVLAFTSWVLSRRFEQGGTARADRWGIFIGEWAPTFFAMGNGLRTYETESEIARQSVEADRRPAGIGIR